MSSLDLLHSAFREPPVVLESKPPRELVASVDIVRTDALGRRVCACAAGQVPAQWLTLTQRERDSLVVPPDPPPDGTLQPGHGGFTPWNTTLGFTIESGT